MSVCASLKVVDTLLPLLGFGSHLSRLVLQTPLASTPLLLFAIIETLRSVHHPSAS